MANDRGDIRNPDIISQLGALQSALETGHGKHQVGNNYFGIKATADQDSVTAATKEADSEGNLYDTTADFASYGDMRSSASGYLDFLTSNKRYDKVLSAKTLEDAIDEMSKSGYATDREYAKKLKDIYAYLKKNNLIGD